MVMCSTNLLLPAEKLSNSSEDNIFQVKMFQAVL